MKGIAKPGHAPPVSLDRFLIVHALGRQGLGLRITGEPIWPIEERPVGRSEVPGEESSPTQPFPTKPPAFDYQGIDEDVGMRE